ncbi:polyhydroxyalkanoate synthesis repressor PhaR [Futiania mangrovi]|uniref:Polyhydroxyalkanoate synthesis repressor PhaR n=1 Tax=Futiania mangrovi TaxID=2959716 RepID=A0A9J6PB14_9PROT|nr:polyhydroxyalkanoate synthesis repressor PhaR [Futiania mangrovii]MCP1336341.1 polyhydroxyalkanoate synthesis repressor PhaR [Futiania mangrovii]
MSAQKTKDGEPVIIKKYANRRLYNTATSSYVTLDHLCQMVKDGVDFVVYDAKTSEDITRSVLTQIIFEEEAKGENLLPIRFLRQLIQFYGDNLQAVVPGYLEASIDTFARHQEQMRQQLSSAFGGAGLPFKQMEEMTRQNMAMVERAMAMFSPFAAKGQTQAPKADEPAGEAEPPRSDDLRELRAQIAEMQEQLKSLAKKPD